MLRRVLWMACLIFFFFLDAVSAGKTWELLSDSDKIDLVWASAAPNPETPFLPEKFDRWVREYGVRGGVNPHMDQIDAPSSYLGYYANTDEKRGNYLYEILNNPSVKTAWGGRGGFGAMEAVLYADKKIFTAPDRVIPLIGFSDFTVFHLLAHQYKWPSLHGVVASFSEEMETQTNGKTSIKPLIEMLTGERTQVEYALEVLNPDCLLELPSLDPQPTTVLGGNFSIVERARGTPIALKPLAGSVVFFEDTSEAATRSKSLFANVAYSKLFDEASALFFGDLPFDSDASLKGWAGEADKILTRLGHRIPILHAPGFGHGPLNQVIPLGTKATLQYTQDGEAKLRISVRKSAYDS